MATHEKLGDLDGVAAALWDIAQIHLSQRKHQEAFEPPAKAYGLLHQIGRQDGIAHVGTVLGQFLFMGGQREEGLKMLARSRDGFRQLGQPEMARQVEQRIAQLEAAAKGAQG